MSSQATGMGQRFVSKNLGSNLASRKQAIEQATQVKELANILKPINKKCGKKYTFVGEKPAEGIDRKANQLAGIDVGEISERRHLDKLIYGKLQMLTFIRT
jgi:hypothetical protein